MFCKKSRMFVCVSALAMITALAAGAVNAEIIGIYVDATTSNTAPSSAITSTASATDNLWRMRTDRGELGTALESLAQSEDSPLLTTTVSGLANGTYDVYAIYWAYDVSPASWRIKAAISGDALVTYGGTSGTWTGATDDGGVSYQRQVLLGQATVTSGSFAVKIDDVPYPTQSDYRARYDGVAYELIPEPGTLALLATGLIGLLCYAWRKRK